MYLFFMANFGRCAQVHVRAHTLFCRTNFTEEMFSLLKKLTFIKVIVKNLVTICFKLFKTKKVEKNVKNLKNKFFSFELCFTR